MKSFNFKLPLATIFLAFFLTVACDNSLEPVDTEQGIYSIHGALDLNKKTNHIRVRDLNAPFTEEATRTIDASVTLKNVNTGFLERLNAETFFEEGVYHHNFVVNQAIDPNTDYEVSVTRSDDRSVVRMITTPTYPLPVADPINEQCYTPIDITFDPVYESTIAFFVEFRAYNVPKTRLGPYVIQADKEAGDKAIFTFAPFDFVRMIPNTLARYRCTDLIVPEFEFFIAHYSPDFYEFITEDDFNVIESTQRFGAVYFDTLVVPIDASRVCPPDCLRP